MGLIYLFFGRFMDDVDFSLLQLPFYSCRHIHRCGLNMKGQIASTFVPIAVIAMDVLSLVVTRVGQRLLRQSGAISWVLVHAFWLFLFLPFFILSTFFIFVFLIASFESSSPFPYLGSLALSEFSLLSPCILVFLMVDHSFVRLSYPSVSIFFVHLCHLLSLMGGSCLEVRPFVGGGGGLFIQVHSSFSSPFSLSLGWHC